MLQSKKILEAFGHAKTINNDNSSRYSQYLNLYIDCTNQKIVGYSIKAYLLEKSLIVNEKIEDRKFHVFYAIMKHMPSEQKQKYRIKSDFSGYHYLVNSLGSGSTNGDQQTYNDILKAFQTFAYTEAEQDAIFNILSLVLLLGNLTFKEPSDKSRLKF